MKIQFKPDPKPESSLKKVKKRIAPVSKKRAIENKAYLVLRKVYLENHPTCEKGFIGCTKNATEIHHLQGRIGKLFTDVTNFVSICRNCHRLIHDKNQK